MEDIAYSVYITVPDRQQAEKIARALVEDRLAACVNIMPEVTSVYRWKGKIETQGEVVLFVKTRSSLFEQLEKRVEELHSYVVPCIIAFKIEAAHQPYLDWLTAGTS